MKRCETKFCRNRVEGERKHCSTCRARQSRERDAVKYAYQTLKDNAKRRGKPFTLTLDEFKNFCRETNYIQGKGKTKTSYSIDCLEADAGYHAWNIQVLTLQENARKGNKVLVYDWQYKHATVVDYSKRLTETVNHF